MEKRALIVPIDYLMLDYGDEDDEEEKVERPNATYMAFVKCKGLLYARKYGLNCSEIPAQPSVNVQVCSSSIILVLGSLTKGENIAEWYRYFGMNKAETWSWTAKYWNTLYIEKCMDMDDALRIRRTIQNFVNTHSDWSRPGIRCSLQELSVCEHWGQSAV